MTYHFKIKRILILILFDESTENSFIRFNFLAVCLLHVYVSTEHDLQVCQSSHSKSMTPYSVKQLIPGNKSSNPYISWTKKDKKVLKNSFIFNKLFFCMFFDAKFELKEICKLPL